MMIVMMIMMMMLITNIKKIIENYKNNKLKRKEIENQINKIKMQLKFIKKIKNHLKIFLILKIG